MSQNFEEFKKNYGNSSLTDTEIALHYLKEIFPKDETRFPPLYFRHQLYAVLKNRGKVAKESNELHKAGKVIFYKLGEDEDNLGEIMVFTSDIKNYILSVTNSNAVSKFMDILPLIKNVHVSASYLMREFRLTEPNLRDLVKESVLIIKDVGSYWLSFPRAGTFLKSYKKGKKEILRMIKKAKYSEMLETELRKRKLSKKATLGMAYHITDIIGSEAVKCIYTTSGALLRYDSR